MEENTLTETQTQKLAREFNWLKNHKANWKAKIFELVFDVNAVSKSDFMILHEFAMDDLTNSHPRPCKEHLREYVLLAYEQVLKFIQSRNINSQTEGGFDVKCRVVGTFMQQFRHRLNGLDGELFVQEELFSLIPFGRTVPERSQNGIKLEKVFNFIKIYCVYFFFFREVEIY